jgi:hypothetical protein
MKWLKYLIIFALPRLSKVYLGLFMVRCGFQIYPTTLHDPVSFSKMESSLDHAPRLLKLKTKTVVFCPAPGMTKILVLVALWTDGLSFWKSYMRGLCERAKGEASCSSKRFLCEKYHCVFATESLNAKKPVPIQKLNDHNVMFFCFSVREDQKHGYHCCIYRKDRNNTSCSVAALSKMNRPYHHGSVL